MANNIPMLGQSPPPYQSIGVGVLKDSSLMGVFPSTPPSTDSASTNMIASFDNEPKNHYVVESTSLSPHEAMYDAIQTSSDDHTDDLHLVASNPCHLPYWLEPSLPVLDYLSEPFPSDESIMEIMNTDESIWEDHHHRSMFLLNTSSVNHEFASLFPTDIFNITQSPILLQNTDSEGNLCSITQTNPIDISAKHDTIEHVHVGQNYSTDEHEAYNTLFKEFCDIFTWSYEEMLGIDPSIVVHEIKTYPMAKPVRQKLRQVHPRKAATIKVEIEKLLKAGFIYPIPLMEWVLNVVPVNKK